MLFCQTFCRYIFNTASGITPGSIVILIHCAAALCDIKFNQTSMLIFTFFSGCLTCSSAPSFLLWAGALNFSLNISPSSSSSSKRSIAFLGLGFPCPAVGEVEKKHNGLRVKIQSNLDCRTEEPILTHLPESDFVRPFPPKKSSSSSSSSNSPPLTPPTPPPPAPAPEGTRLGAAGVPFSLFSSESESFPELNRLLSV